MANTDRPHGFRPYGPLLRNRPYSVDVTETTGIFIGDIVMMEADGMIAPATAASVAKLGAALTYHAGTLASTGPADECLVADDVDQEYEAQDDAGATPTAADIGSITDHVAGTGSTTTLLSAHELGWASLGQSDGGFKILDLINREDNEIGDNADWRCQLNTGEGLLNLAAGV